MNKKTHFNVNWYSTESLFHCAHKIKHVPECQWIMIKDTHRQVQTLKVYILKPNKRDRSRNIRIRKDKGQHNQMKYHKTNILQTYVEININTLFLILKHSPCSACCITSSGWFPGVWILYSDVSEHPVCSFFIGSVSRKIDRGYRNVGI